MARPPKPIDVELTVLSARDLKNVNWRHGDLRPYAVAWVDPDIKVSTRVDQEGDTNPSWDEKLTISVGNRPLEDAELTIEIVHEKPSELTKPLVGTARIPLSQVLDEVGFEEKLERTLKLKRPSGRPQGKLVILIRLREKRWLEPQYAQPYGSRGYNPNYPAYPSLQYPYANPPAGYANPPAGYPSSYQPPNPYAQPSPDGQTNPYPGSNPSLYGGSYYNEALPAPYYGQPDKPKSSKFGMVTRLAAGAVAGALDWLVNHQEDKFEERVAERVEDNLGYDDDYGGGDDDY